MISFKNLVFNSFINSVKGLFEVVESLLLISVDKQFEFIIEVILLPKIMFDSIIMLEKWILLEKKFKNFAELIFVLKYLIELLLLATFL